MHGEQFIQFIDKDPFSSHQVHHSKHIMRHVEREVPGISLNKALAIGLQYIEIFLE